MYIYIYIYICMYVYVYVYIKMYPVDPCPLSEKVRLTPGINLNQTSSTAEEGTWIHIGYVFLWLRSVCQGPSTNYSMCFSLF